MQQYRLLDLPRLPSRPVRDRHLGGSFGSVQWAGGWVCLLACLTLSACADIAEGDPYPRLQPLDTLLAEADTFSADPGPAQVQRASQLQNRVRESVP